MIILSGGARGADTLFGSIPNTYCYHFSFEGHNSTAPLNGAVVKVPWKQLLTREKELIQVFEKLNRPYVIRNQFTKPLLLRNMYQIVNKTYKSELCIAIADVYRTAVSGGTNYAVTKAIIELIPVLVLDKNSNRWYEYCYKELRFIPLIKEYHLSNYSVITGIGSRDISRENVSEIRRCFKVQIIGGNDG